MSKKGKVLLGAERTLLFKLMTFFEEEKKKKLLIKPYNVEDLIKMKRLKRIANSKIKNPTQLDTDVPTEIELKLLENEKKYQSLLKSFDNVAKRTAAATGVSERTLRNIKLEAKNKKSDPLEPGTSSMLGSTTEIKLTTPKKKPPKKRLDINDFMLCSIRNIIERYYVSKEVPTLGKILAEAKRDFDFPGQKITLWKIITTELGYTFKKDKNMRQHLVKKPELIISPGAKSEDSTTVSSDDKSDAGEMWGVEVVYN